eukprot:9203152-Alexandrium_andersonii.AAC.1
MTSGGSNGSDVSMPLAVAVARRRSRSALSHLVAQEGRCAAQCRSHHVARDCCRLFFMLQNTGNVPLRSPLGRQ